jgi:hypothetical protein
MGEQGLLIPPRVSVDVGEQKVDEAPNVHDLHSVAFVLCSGRGGHVVGAVSFSNPDPMAQP